MLFADYRTHLRIAVERSAELDLLGFLRHRVNKFLVDRFLNKNSTAGGAHFALINKNSEQCAINGSFKVRVGKENIGRLSTQLKRDALHGISRLFDYDLSDRSAARESDLVNIGVLDQRCAGSFTETGDHISHAFRQPDLFEPLRHLKRGKRSLLGRLEHASATGRERRSQLPRCHQQRVIPGNNLPGHSYWFFQR